jgi:hypothetical protein
MDLSKASYEGTILVFVAMILSFGFRAWVAYQGICVVREIGQLQEAAIARGPAATVPAPEQIEPAS